MSAPSLPRSRPIWRKLSNLGEGDGAVCWIGRQIEPVDSVCPLRTDKGPQWQRSLFPNSDGKYSSDVQHLLDMPLRRWSRLRSALGLTSLILSGCRGTEALVSPETLVGSYSYVSHDPANKETDHNQDHLLLESDGRYDLVQGGATKAVAEKKGTWTVVPGNPPNALLDTAGYPIEIMGHEVRLLVDDDLGIWWVRQDKPKETEGTEEPKEPKGTDRIDKLKNRANAADSSVPLREIEVRSAFSKGIEVIGASSNQPRRQQPSQFLRTRRSCLLLRSGDPGPFGGN